MNRNDDIINEIKMGSNAVFEQLYRKHFGLISTLVKKNNGSDEEAKEVFQETMIVLFKNVRDDKIKTLQAEISTYIYAIARNIWLNMLKKMKSKGEIEFLDEVKVDIEEIDLYDNHELQDKENQYDKVNNALLNLKQDCQDIIMNSYYKKLAASKIAELMGYSESFVKVKKFRCMEQLKKLVQEQKN